MGDYPERIWIDMEDGGYFSRKYDDGPVYIRADVARRETAREALDAIKGNRAFRCGCYRTLQERFGLEDGDRG